jgi:proteasome lid subunit RPN8/RPN11
MTTSEPLEADPNAEALADALLADQDTQRQLLAETVAESSARMLEAGRTVCGVDADPKEPRDRSNRSVDLAPCDPDEQTGIYHTHPGVEQLQRPEHSLPDFANVAFEGVTASVVVGADSHSVVVTAVDKEAQAESFRNAIGVDVDSTRGVVSALRANKITRPARARKRVREAFGETTYRAGASHRDVLPDRVVAAAPDADRDPLWRAYDSTEREVVRGANVLRRQGRVGGGLLRDLTFNTRISDVVIGTAVGDLTSKAIESVLFD